MAKISQLTTPSPVLAVVRKPACVVPDSPSGLALALDGVRDPGNMGTILRTADWFGVGTIYISPDCVDIYNPKVIQSTMGSIFRVKAVEAPVAGICERFKKAGLPVYGTLLDGRDIYAASLKQEGLIVMGNESVGISPAVRALVTDPLLIPRAPHSKAESLNVAVATAVTLAEFRRRI